jgi:hypothetical protein
MVMFRNNNMSSSLANNLRTAESASRLLIDFGD